MGKIERNTTGERRLGCASSLQPYLLIPNIPWSLFTPQIKFNSNLYIRRKRHKMYI
ncbi:hypothetical protein JHK82_013482 [Glycine max]|uniref:Uncharacterized protein n=1 Tax=Glycine max TaxID=3847 RepID=K7KRC6_SOYBN|nr:hypothetical protein JHK87_013408 [Glycine soja]KAG5041375.1 hypothetical protein JHK85_013851 [Glycine max]KAG5058504.1 hypothetical protein JHK86_013500 [Glycine max]KAG5155513.1 hypothetical protein JHK82_013482 [Glycine max]KAH1135381.1 hypothetical protein GYH30_013238 [Glycine max]